MSGCLRATLMGHVESAVWRAARRDDAHSTLLGDAVREAAGGFGFATARELLPAEPDDRPAWAALATGEVDWADLLARSTDHPGDRHIGLAALCQAARTGVLRQLLAGVAQAGPLVGFGIRDGWCTPTGEATDALRALAGVGSLPDPAGWLEARLAFDLDWFWAPLTALCASTAVAATFGAPGRAETFRAASARVNRLSTQSRLRTARAVTRALGGTAAKVLEIGAVSPVWGQALPGARRTVVDYPAVLAVVTPDASLAGQDPLAAPPDGTFDVIIVDELLHTAPVEIGKRLLAAVTGRLRNRGLLIVVEPLMGIDGAAPLPLLASQVKVVLTGGGRIWSEAELRSTLRAESLRAGPARSVGGVCVSVARH